MSFRKKFQLANVICEYIYTGDERLSQTATPGLITAVMKLETEDAEVLMDRRV